MKTEAWTPVKDADDNVLYLQLPHEMEKATSDDRTYQLIKLENGLQALLVHDATTEEAAAAMNVGVGYLSDPDDMPGLAHLCEHLLFMGSKDYHRKNAFLSWIKSHGGSSNAYTVASNTCYFLSIGTAHLAGAIKRFSAFFRAPLFDKDCVASELNAVHSEYLINREADLYRLFQLFKAEALPGHPWPKFGVGNKRSLTPMEEDHHSVKQYRRDRLQKWWEEHYSPSIMGLVILGRESLIDLAAMVAHNFSSIPMNRKGSLAVETIPWGIKQQANITFAKTVSDVSTIEVSFCLPSEDKFYDSKAAAFISRLIARQGPGSLHAYLRQEEWITQLSSEPHNAGRGFSFLGIKAILTRSGLIHYQLVLEAIYAYLYLLPWALVPSSVHFEEFKILQNSLFLYSDKIDSKCYVNRLAEVLLRPWPRERLLKGATGVWKQDDSMIRVMLGIYLAPESGSVILSSKHLLSIGMDGPWSRETWYGTEYVTDKLNPDLFKNAKSPNIIQTMSLPGPNRFIPENFDIKCPKELTPPGKYPHDWPLPAQLKPAESPSLLRRTGKSDLWFKQDDQFFLPKGYIGVYIRSPVSRRSNEGDDAARNTVMTKLVVGLLMDALRTEFYDALLAGLRFSLLYDEDGNLVLQTGGYTDKQLLLLGELLETIKSHVFKECRFLTYKEQLRQAFENEQYGGPSLLSRRLMDYCLRNIAWTAEEMEGVLRESSSVTLEDVQEHLANLLAPAKTTLLVTGNFDKNDAKKAQDLVDDVLGSSNDPDIENSTNSITANKNWIYFHHLINDGETNNAVEYYLQITDASPIKQAKLQATLLLFAHLVDDPFIAQLRTEDQLGYNVSSAPWVQVSAAGMVFRVQSESSALVVEDRIDEFLKNYGEKLSQIDNLEGQQAALVKKLKAKPVNQDQESVRFAFSIFDGTYDFTLRGKNAELIEQLKKEDVVDFYRKYIDPSSLSRAKLSIHALSKQDQTTAAIWMKGGPLNRGYDLVWDLKGFRQAAGA